MAQTRVADSDTAKTRTWTLPSLLLDQASKSSKISRALPAIDVERLCESTQGLLNTSLELGTLRLGSYTADSDPLALIVEHKEGVRFATVIPTPIWHWVLERVVGDTPRGAAPLDAERGALLYVGATLLNAALGRDYAAVGVVSTQQSLLSAMECGDRKPKWTGCCNVTLGPCSGALRFHFDAPLPISASRKALPDLPVSCRLVAGRTTIAVTQLRKLTRDQVILLDTFSIEQTDAMSLSGSAVLLPEGHSTTCWECVIHNGTVSIKSPSTLNAERPQGIDGIPITLDVELARVTLSVGELEHMAPGHVLRLAKQVGDPVLLSAGGHPIAEAEVVDIEGELGVRVVKMLRAASV